MSIAWGSLVLLVLLLPGFLFFVGMYIPEKFTRQLAERSPLGQLAGTVFISFLVHAFFFATNRSTCSTHCVSLNDLFAIVGAPSTTAFTTNAAIGRIENSAWQVAAYVLAAAVSGLGLGCITGALVVEGPFRFLAQHTWVYGLATDDPGRLARVAAHIRSAMGMYRHHWRAWGAGSPSEELTAAYVLSDVQHDGRVLLYRGYLKSFGLQSDGRFSYLVLAQSVRLYLYLEPKKPVTSPRALWHTISQGQPASKGEFFESAYLFIEGNRIANVMFDRERVTLPGSGQRLSDIIQRVVATMEQERRSSHPISTAVLQQQL